MNNNGGCFCPCPENRWLLSIPLGRAPQDGVDAVARSDPREDTRVTVQQSKAAVQTLWNIGKLAIPFIIRSLVMSLLFTNYEY